ncbi:MAG: PDZ domain-containing protein, partial [Oscillospiraceae bacterium]
HYCYVTGRAFFGVTVVSLNPSNGPINGLPSQGVYIADIQEGSDLLNKGVRARDVILELNDKKVTSSDELLKELENFSPGDTITLKIYRVENDETFSVNVKLIESK